MAQLTPQVRYFLALVAVTIAAAVGLILFALPFHTNFIPQAACDTAAYQNAIVNTLHGRWFHDTAYNGPNVLGLHSVVILVLIAPIYALFPTMPMLIALQIAVSVSSVWPVYWIAWERLKEARAAFGFGLLVLLSPYFWHVTQMPFHPETLMLPFVLWAWLFYLRRRLSAFVLFLLLAMSCTEQEALLAVVLGLGLIVVHRSEPRARRFGIVAMGVGALWLALYFGVVQPAVRLPEQIRLSTHYYTELGVASTSDVVLYPLRHPQLFLERMLSVPRWVHVYEVAGPLLPLAAIGIEPLLVLVVLSIPLFLMNWDDFVFWFHAYYFQYALLAGILGGMTGLYWLRSRRFLHGLVWVVLLAVSVVIGWGTWREIEQEPGNRHNPFNVELRRAFEALPRSAGVFCQHRYSAWLSNRRVLVMGDFIDGNPDFDAAVNARAAETGVSAAQIEFIVCDLRDGQCGPRGINLHRDEYARRQVALAAMKASGKWIVWWERDEAVILRRVPISGSESNYPVTPSP